MMIELLTRDSQARLWLPGEVQWTAKASRQMGSARFTVPRNHPVWESGVLLPEGGQLVRITDGRVIWSGIADVPTWTVDGAEITALEVGQWVGYRVLHRRREFRAAPAALIAAHAVRDAFVGAATLPVTIGPCAVGAPLIPRFTFSGQTVEAVLGELQTQTGQEWEIDHRTYQFRWQPQTGRYHEGLIVDLGTLFPQVRVGELTDRYQQVTEHDRRTRRSFTAWNGTTAPLFPAQTVLEVN